MPFTLAQTRAAMLKKTAGSGLTPSDVQKLKMQPLTGEQLKAWDGLPQYLAAFSIPYFDLQGRVTKFVRFRYVEEAAGFKRLGTKRLIRYAQPPATLNEVYLPPTGKVPWSEIAKADAPIIITEGELKAACSTKMGLPTMGLGGVTIYGNRKNGDALLPVFKQFKWNTRNVFICFDSDATTNPMVLLAEGKLARELTELGAVVYICRLPNLEGNEKTGLDDYLVSEGIETFKEEVLEAAMEFAGSKALHALNEEVIYINGPDIVFNPEKSHRMRTDKFCSSHYANRRYFVPAANGSMVERSAPVEWMKWESRAELREFTYKPGEAPIVDGCLNLWQPWPHTPKKGDVSLWHRLLDHIFTNTEADSRKWFEQWVAYPMQHPGTKLKQATVMWGGQGTGKSFLAETIGRIYGEHNSVKFDNTKLSSSFNDWAEHRQFGIGEEIVVQASEKRAISEQLKTLVTDVTININRKYLNSYVLPNCMNLMLLSNHPGALKLEEDDRRMFVHHVKAPRMTPDLYRPLDEWSHSPEGLSALFHHLLNIDLTGFDPQAAAFITQDKLNMVQGGRSEHGQWVADLKALPDEVLKTGQHVLNYSLWTTEALHMLFKSKHDRSLVGPNALGNEMSMQGIRRAYQGVIRTFEGSRRLWVIRDDPKFARMTPAQLGDYYNKERGKETSTKAPVPTKRKY
jgi:hypothetical protein